MKQKVSIHARLLKPKVFAFPNVNKVDELLSTSKYEAKVNVKNFFAEKHGEEVLAPR